MYVFGNLQLNCLLSRTDKLQAERELGDWAGQFTDPNAEVEDDGTDGNNGMPIRLTRGKDVDEASSGGAIGATPW